MEKDSNLGIALAVAPVVPLIKAEIAGNFFKELKRRLGDMGFGTSDLNEIGNPFNQYVEFGIWKPHWGKWEKYCIDLELQNKAHRVSIGVWRNPKKVGKRPDNEFAEAFEKSNRFAGKSSEWWEWFEKLERYDDWNEAETLVQMHFKADQVVNYFSEKIATIVQIAGPLIDRRCKR